MGTQCSFIKEDGQQCLAPALAETDLCFWHNPAQAASRALARKKGGSHKRAPKLSDPNTTYKVGSVKEISKILEDVLNDIMQMENSHARARTATYLCQIALKALEVGEIENRVAALEESIGGKK